MAEHTPGPWHVGACKEHALDEALTNGLRCVAVRNEGGNPVPDTIENLTLKAAAPDLLEALEHIVYWHDHDGRVDESWWQAGRDAVAKARKKEAERT